MTCMRQEDVHWLHCASDLLGGRSPDPPHHGIDQEFATTSILSALTVSFGLFFYLSSVHFWQGASWSGLGWENLLAIWDWMTLHWDKAGCEASAFVVGVKKRVDRRYSSVERNGGLGKNILRCLIDN